MTRITLPKCARILDVPCGYGRHSVWLAQMTHAITAVDIDPERVSATKTALSEIPDIRPFRCIAANAEELLPLKAQSFDLAIVIHYYAPEIFEIVSRVLKPGGHLIFETFGAQGDNWRALPEIGQAERLLSSKFNVVDIRERLCGPEKSRAVVQALARRRK